MENRKVQEEKPKHSAAAAMSKSSKATSNQAASHAPSMRCAVAIWPVVTAPGARPSSSPTATRMEGAIIMIIVCNDHRMKHEERHNQSYTHNCQRV